MRGYRNKVDIIADILGVIGENGRKTQIMKQANLSFKLLQKYLAEMVKAELISFENETHLFKLEDKGREFLEFYRKYLKTSRSAKRRLDDLAAKKKALEELCFSSASIDNTTATSSNRV